VADLFQVAGQLAMPLAKIVVLQKDVVLAKTARLSVSIKFPEVKQQAEILVRFALIPDADPSKPVALGDVRFEVFPQDTTKELAAMLQPKSDDAPGIVLFGSGHKLRQFLTQIHVRFEDGGDDIPPSFQTNRVYAGEVSGDEQFEVIQDRSAGARIAVFSPDESLPPGVYADRSGAGAFVHVTTPLLDHVADDPREQLGLMKVFRFLLNSPSSN
jgi:hypothetical protein